MRSIEVSEMVFQKLQAIAVPLLDTPNTVIERLLDQAALTSDFGRAKERAPQIPKASVVDAAQPSGNVYTHTRPLSVAFEGRSTSVTTFKEVYLFLCREMAAAHPDRFEQVLTLRGRQRSYFDTIPEKMTQPQRIEGTRIYAETNFSAQNIMDRGRELVSLFGHDPDAIVVDSRPIVR